MKNKHTFRNRMRSRIVCSLLLLASLSGRAQTIQHQVFEDWSTTSGTQNTFQRSVVRTAMLSGVVYSFVTGATINSSGNYDIITEKFGPTGNLLWTRQYDGTGHGNDVGTDLRVANNGEVYVCGTEYESSGDSSDAVVIKYSPGGTQRWVRTYNGAGSHNDGFSSLLLSGTSVVAVGAAWSGANLYDMLAQRYDTAGTAIWTTTYDNVGLNDGAVSLVSRSGSLYITGASQSASTTSKIAVWQITPSTGAIVGTTLSSGTAFGIDEVTDIQEDASSNVYITGGVLNMGTGYDFKTFKYDAGLNLLWSATYDGSGLDDVATGITVDPAGNVIVTGYTNTTTQGKDYATVKYNSAGVQQWVSTFDHETRNDNATAIVAKDTNQIFVTGYSEDSVSLKNYYTIKYDNAGNEKWRIAFNSIGNGSDIATSIAIDTTGGVVVTGQSTINTTSSYNTVRYIETDVTMPPDTIPTSSAFLFEQNQGQLYNTSSVPETRIKFYHKSSWPAVYFSDTAVSYVWAHIDTTASSTDTMHRVDMRLVNGNLTKVYPMNKQGTYYNYLLGNLSQPLPDVPLYSTLVYQEVYTKVDVVYSSNTRGLKHYFIMKGGSSVSSIRMKFSGADSVRVDNDTLKVYSLLGVLKQRKAIAFEIDNSGNRVTLAWQPTYHVSGDTVSFTGIGSFTAGRTLVFECDWGPAPTAVLSVNNLEWSSFLGGSGSDDSWDIAADQGNNVWTSGTSQSATFAGQVGPVTIPLTAADDAFIARFDNQAVNQWIAYIGGSGYDYGRSIAVDKTGTALLVGITGSTNFINMSSAGINYTAQAGGNGFFVALNGNGTSTLCDSYIGGAGSDEAVGIAEKPGLTIGTKDIYIVGNTNSASNFPFATSGNYNQQVIGGGKDAFIMRLDISYSNVWTSLFGGSGTDWFNDVAMRDINNNPVIVGSTSSSTPSTNACGVPLTVGEFPFCDNSGTEYSQIYGGGQMDDMIVEFGNVNQQLRWSTYFGGTGDESFQNNKEPNVAVINENVYVVGATQTATFPTLNSLNGGSYNQPYVGSTSGRPDVYIARFDQNRQQTWTTFYGSDGVKAGAYGVCGDANYNVFITGEVTESSIQSSPNYCTVPTSGAFPICNFSGLNYLETNQMNGQGRVFIAGFNASDDVIWSTLFGQDASSYGTGVYATGNKLFLSGRTNYLYSLADYNASSNLDYYQPVAPTTSANYDDGISRFDISGLVGMGEQQPKTLEFFSIFPNPASQTVTLQLSTALKGTFTIQVTDAMGRTITELKASPEEKAFTLDVSSFADGIYFVRVISNEMSASKKFIKMQ